MRFKGPTYAEPEAKTLHPKSITLSPGPSVAGRANFPLTRCSRIDEERIQQRPGCPREVTDPYRAIPFAPVVGVVGAAPDAEDVRVVCLLERCTAWAAQSPLNEGLQQFTM